MKDETKDVAIKESFGLKPRNSEDKKTKSLE